MGGRDGCFINVDYAFRTGQKFAKELSGGSVTGTD